MDHYLLPCSGNMLSYLRLPYSIKADLDDNLIVADTANHIIRKIWVNEAKVTTIAGNGTSGFADGPAINGALFNYPEGITIYNMTDLIISDTSNQVVRYLKLTCPPPALNLCSEASPAQEKLVGTYNASTVAGNMIFLILGIPLKIGYSGTDFLTFRDGPADAVFFSRPIGMAWDIDGNLIIAGLLGINERPWF